MGQHVTPRLILTGYTVQYVDMRTPKPRETYTDTFVLDADTIAALARTGQTIPDFIRGRYEKGGYNAISIDKAGPRRTVPLDLRELWRRAE